MYKTKNVAFNVDALTAELIDCTKDKFKINFW